MYDFERIRPSIFANESIAQELSPSPMASSTIRRLGERLVSRAGLAAAAAVPSSGKFSKSTGWLGLAALQRDHKFVQRKFQLKGKANYK